MSAVAIDWDAKPLLYEDDRYYLRVRCGIAMQLNNRLNVLRVTGHAPLAKAITDKLYALASEAGRQDAGFKRPAGEYQLMPHAFATPRGELAVTLAWGLKLNGGRRRKQQTGDWLFVAMLTEQVDDVLLRVFDTVEVR